MRPVIGSGFGCFSRVLGPWSDYFPSSGGYGLADSQFGVALGTKIIGGERGATITGIVLDSPFNIAGNNFAQNWRFLVLKGDVNPASLQQLDNEFQLAANGWPRKGATDIVSFPVLFEKIFGNQRVPSGWNSSAVTDPPSFKFGDDGPSVGNQETMTALLIPLFNATGVPGYGANNSSFVSLSIFGRYSRRQEVSGDKDTSARSIPRGRIGGI
jgi:hypothetical protein